MHSCYCVICPSSNRPKVVLNTRRNDSPLINPETVTSKRQIPDAVFQAPSLEWGVTPPPDQAYEVVYEYYRVPVDLESATDVPSIPERFRHVIIDGAMYHAYMFRSNEQAANIAKGKFEEGLKRMRTILVNRFVYMRSTAIIHYQHQFAIAWNFCS